MRDDRATKVHWLPRVALALFVVGALLMAIAFAHVDGVGVWFRCGGLVWIAAYFVVLFDGFSRKLPVQTRDGVVCREDGLLKYSGPYLFLGIIGLGALIVAVAA